ncbi:MAG TPA: AbrB/MazE/SpoVT family DNA-binding domain-containing protein [Candidatus Paceibacterota bacterium]|nr:AbrB/MazE/SpoVT family DNA-binding domain-containing protein [Candidatus Paceibacterota bacterium]
MTTKVQKWGNSLAVRLPKALAEGSRLREGSEVAFKIQGKDIVISSSIKPRYTLKELANGITKKNSHKEIDWGPARGKEIW